MSTLSIRPRAEKLDRPRRPFGQGLHTQDLVESPTLAIKGIAYAVEPLSGDEGETVVRLVKQSGDGAVYDCVQGRDGHRACDCPAFVYSKASPAAPCKHLRSVAEAGLFPAVDAIAAALAHLEAQGYGKTRLARVEQALRLNVEVGVYSVAIDKADRPAVKALLGQVEAPTPSKPVAIMHGPIQAPAPVAPVNRCEGHWDWSSLDLGTADPILFPSPDEAYGFGVADAEDGKPEAPGEDWSDEAVDAYRRGHRAESATDVAWSPEAIAAFMQAERAETRAEAIGREVDEAWWTGHTLGRLGIEAEPNRDWQPHEQAAFRNGLHWGRIDEEADRQAAFDDELAMLASCNTPEGRDLW